MRLVKQTMINNNKVIIVAQASMMTILIVVAVMVTAMILMLSALMQPHDALTRGVERGKGGWGAEKGGSIHITNNCTGTRCTQNQICNITR